MRTVMDDGGFNREWELQGGLVVDGSQGSMLCRGGPGVPGRAGVGAADTGSGFRCRLGGMGGWMREVGGHKKKYVQRAKMISSTFPKGGSAAQPAALGM